MVIDKACVTATIHGPRRSQEYSFLVGPKHVYIGLPAMESDPDFILYLPFAIPITTGADNDA